jgi:hypothetical protein
MKSTAHSKVFTGKYSRKTTSRCADFFLWSQLFSFCGVFSEMNVHKILTNISLISRVAT